MEKLQSPQGARIVATDISMCRRISVTVPARGANCSSDNDGILDEDEVTVPARGANCSYNYVEIL